MVDRHRARVLCQLWLHGQVGHCQQLCREDLVDEEATECADIERKDSKCIGRSFNRTLTGEAIEGTLVESIVQQKSLHSTTGAGTTGIGATSPSQTKRIANEDIKT